MLLCVQMHMRVCVYLPSPFPSFFFFLSHNLGWDSLVLLGQWSSEPWGSTCFHFPRTLGTTRPPNVTWALGIELSPSHFHSKHFYWRSHLVSLGIRMWVIQRFPRPCGQAILGCLLSQALGTFAPDKIFPVSETVVMARVADLCSLDSKIKSKHVYKPRDAI